MALLQPGGNDGQAMGALSFGSGPDASLAASTPARGAGCGPGPAQLVAAALAPIGLAARLGRRRFAALGGNRVVVVGVASPTLALSRRPSMSLLRPGRPGKPV